MHRPTSRALPVTAASKDRAARHKRVAFSLFPFRAPSSFVLRDVEEHGGEKPFDFAQREREVENSSSDPHPLR